MKNWLFQRLMMTVLALFAVLIFTFFLMRLLPGDPFLTEQSLPEESYIKLKKHWGLDKPIPEQFIQYMKVLGKGDLGTSMAYPDRKVSEIIVQALPISAFLGFFSLCIALGCGLGTAILITLWNKNRTSYSYLLLTTFAISTPTFLSGALFQYCFAIEGAWFPVARWGSWQQAVLPIATLAFTPAAFMGRLLYLRINSELKEPYVRFAESKGLSEHAILFRHVLRNACSPMLAYLGPFTANIVTGSFIVEKIYAIPGLGQWFVTSVTQRDYPLIISLALLYCVILMTCVLIGDLASAWANPVQRRALFQGEPA